MLGTFFTITSTDTQAVVSNAGNLIADFMPLLVIIVGIVIAIFIIKSILGLKG